MKLSRLFSVLLAVCLTVTLIPLATTEAQAASNLTGVWEGYYYANQGQTGLTLTIYEDGTGVFDFYNMPGRSNAKDGKYSVRVAEENGTIQIHGTEWIDHPSGYSFVSLYGALSGDEFTGKVNNSGSWPFYLVKENQAQQELDMSIYDGHKYQVIDEGMTWKKAKRYCEELGGYLACVNSAGEQAYLQRLIQNGGQKMYWLGGQREDEDFWWLDGTEVTYTNWDVGEPNNYLDDEKYIQIYRQANPHVSGSQVFRWNDAPNDNTIENEEDFFSIGNVGFICEWDTYSGNSDWATPELEEAYEKGLIPDSIVGEDMAQPITRGEFAAVCVKLYEQVNSARTVMSSEAKFRDIANDVNRNDILKAYNISAVRGFSAEEYGPNVQLNREQMAAMLCRVIKRTTWTDWTFETDNQDRYRLDLTGMSKFADDADISAYAKESVYYMAKNQIILGKGNNLFAPKNTTDQQEALGYANATREQALAISLRIYNQMK